MVQFRPEYSVNKTVSISQSINRINSFSDKKIEDNKIQFIKKCSQLRNEFIHFKAVFVTEEMKKKYAMLYHVYIEIHDKFISTQIAILDDSQKYSMIELSNFTEDMVIFRGWEHTQEEYKQLVEDIRINNQIHFYIDENGVEYKRFRYGYEVEELGQKYLDKLNITDRTPEEVLSRTLKYCGACEAIFGEYHLDLCDIEVCPKCYDQINSCDCFPTRSANRFAHHITP